MYKYEIIHRNNGVILEIANTKTEVVKDLKHVINNNIVLKRTWNGDGTITLRGYYECFILRFVLPSDFRF